MNSTKENHIVTADQLQKYFSGQMTGEEKNALEKRALEDPFLYEAMEGFEANPELLHQFVIQQKKATNSLNSLLLFSGAILTSALIILLVVLHDQPSELPEPNYIPSSSNSDSEIEVLPLDIDTLIQTKPEDQIQLAEVVSDKKEIQKKIQYEDAPGELPIVVEENFQLDLSNLELIPEPEKLTKAELVPATHIHDLFVVDYRRIKRNSSSVIYTKYELSGTSAAFENTDKQNNQDLLETKIEISYWEYLEKTLLQFSNESYKNSLNRFLIILEQYPDDLNALFYGGLAYYNLGNYQKSLQFFEAVLQNDLFAFKEESKWYKAKTLIKLNQKEEAKKILDEIIAGGGFYTEDAILLKKNLK